MLAKVYIILAVLLLATAQDNIGVNNYNFNYQARDGSQRTEEGKFVNGIWTVIGSFSYTGSDGVVYTRRYIADDQGYRILPNAPASPFPPLSIGSGGTAALLGIGR